MDIDLIFRIAMAALVAATAWFAIQAVLSARARSALNKVELTQLIIDEAQAARKRVPLKDKARAYLARQGYTGDVTPVVGVFLLAFAALVLVMQLLGFNLIIAILAAGPFTFIAVVAGTLQAAAVRRRRFNKQLLDALRMIAGSLESGKGINQAIEQAVGASEDPFRTEIAAALSSTVSNKNLVESLRPVGKKYPSRAWDLFISALEVDQLIGGSLQSAIRQAANLLQKDFDLGQKADRELASYKQEFIGLLGFVGFIAVTMFQAGGDLFTTAFTGFPGLPILLAGFVNIIIGVVRAMRLFRSAGDNQ